MMSSAGRPVPAGIGDIDPSWLSVNVTEVGRPDDVGVPERIGVEFGLASEVWRIPVGPPLGSIVVKLWDTTTTAGTGEVDFYLRFGEDPGICVPRCHYAATDESTGRGVLVLQDLSAGRQGDAATTMGPRDRNLVVGAIAAFHARWWGAAAPAGLPRRSHLPTLGNNSSFIAERRAVFERRFGAVGTGPLAAVILGAEHVLPAAEAIVAEAPPTLLHGDLHLDNVLFLGERSGPCFLDWTRTGTGPGVRSVANIAFNMSPPGVLDEVICAYVDGLRRCGVSYDLTAARRHLAAATVRAVLVWTLGIVRFEPASRRQEALVERTLAGARSACEAWSVAMPGWPAMT